MRATRCGRRSSPPVGLKAPRHPSAQDPMHGSHEHLARRRAHSLCHTTKSALGCSVAEPARPAEWLNPSGSRVRGSKCGPRTTSCLRPCGIKTPQTRWLDSNPRPTAMPMALDAFAALLLHIEPQPPGKRRVYGRLTILLHICKREGSSVLARCRTRAGHVVDRGISIWPGPSLLWGPSLIDRITRHLPPSPLNSSYLGGQWLFVPDLYLCMGRTGLANIESPIPQCHLA